ncbi:hypothetical protein AB0B01_30585 [Streptomyces sp. NPDC044571]|uniref:hypothetical protein n=1 Tax=Streptomyces sp. NPDC044571 TaxID=3155371 RepID=UPI0033E3EA62
MTLGLPSDVADALDVLRLLQHPAARRAAALLRQDLSEELIEEIIALGSSRSLASNSSLPDEVRARFAEHTDSAVRCAVAGSARDEPPGLLARLAAEPDLSVRQFLTSNEHVTPDLMGCLAVDPEPSVRVSVIQNWRAAPDPVRRAMLTDPEPRVRREAVLAYSPPPELLPGLLADPATRAAAVRHAHPTPELAADPDPRVREAVADHAELPAALRDVLAGDPDVAVRSAIAARPDLPPALLERLLPTLESDDLLTEWLVSSRRGLHAGPPPAPAPSPATREEAEALLRQAGL